MISEKYHLKSQMQPSLFGRHKSALKCLPDIFNAPRCGRLTPKYVFPQLHPAYIYSILKVFYTLLPAATYNNQLFPSLSHGLSPSWPVLPTLTKILYLHWTDITNVGHYLTLKVKGGPFLGLSTYIFQCQHCDKSTVVWSMNDCWRAGYRCSQTWQKNHTCTELTFNKC